MNPSLVDLQPLSVDVPASFDLSREALVAAFSRSGPASDAEPRIASVAARIRSGEMEEGRLCRLGGIPAGVAFWESGHPSGITVQTLYLRPAVARPPIYSAFLTELERQAGRAVFLPGGLVGLSESEEAALMLARGVDRFERSEMRWPTGKEPPPIRVPEGVQIRPVRAEDEPTVAALHRAAFVGTFDFYMYLTDPDPVADSTRSVHEMMGGQFGEFLGWASAIAEDGTRPLGASLAVRAPYGPLLISVMVDRPAQGAGIGRALVGGNLHALVGRGEKVVALNVTEGNLPAVRLYEHLGFVRSIGPEHSWYSRAAIPVAPGGILTTAQGAGPPGRTGSATNRTPRT
jgi:GNAT superfamily N-acetyltransferase